MTDRAEFETRLTVALARYAERAPVAVEADALVRAVSVGNRRRRVATLRSARPVTVLAAAMLAILAAAVGLVVGSWLLSRHASLPGAFTKAVPMWSETSQTVMARLQDGRVLVVGRSYAPGGDLVRSEIFDSGTDAYGPSSGPMSEARVTPSATTLRDGRVLVAGGSRSDVDLGQDVVLASADIFDPSTGRFTPTGPMLDARAGHTATLLADGRVLVAGGHRFGPNGSATPLATAEVYDPIAGSWASVGPMMGPREGHTAILLPDGRVLIAGGTSVPAESFQAANDTAELFDPTTGAFTPTGVMATPRSRHGAALLPDGRVLIVGGTTGLDGPTATLASAELYDPSTGRFSVTGSLATERSGLAATLLVDGRVLVTGGSNGNGDPLSAELYDPATGAFQLAALAATGHEGPAVRLVDGRVLVAGSPSEIYDPAATPLAPAPARVDRSFVATGSPLQARSRHSATRLRDGRVLIVGGDAQGDSAPLATAEIYDPASGTFNATGPLATPRAGHSAFLLPDGRVLIAGGAEGETLDLEAYDPASGAFRSAGSVPPGRPGSPERVTPVQLADGRILLFGPARSSSGTPVYAVDPADLTLTTEASLPACDVVDGSVPLADGRVIVLCSRSGSAHATPRLVDPRTWASTEVSLPWGSSNRPASVNLADGRDLVVFGPGEALVIDARRATLQGGDLGAPLFDVSTDSTATALRDGRVLIVGYDGAVNWDPATGASSPLPAPLAHLDGQTANLLDDGHVLIVGGTALQADRTAPLPPGAELFDPSATR